MLGPMPDSRSRRLRRLGTAFAAIAPLALAGVAAAASQGPPTPELNGRVNLLAAYGVMFLLTGLVLFVSLWPSKRGHQD